MPCCAKMINNNKKLNNIYNFSSKIIITHDSSAEKIICEKHFFIQIYCFVNSMFYKLFGGISGILSTT